MGRLAPALFFSGASSVAAAAAATIIVVIVIAIIIVPAPIADADLAVVPPPITIANAITIPDAESIARPPALLTPAPPEHRMARAAAAERRAVVSSIRSAVLSVIFGERV